MCTLRAPSLVERLQMLQLQLRQAAEDEEAAGAAEAAPDVWSRCFFKSPREHVSVICLVLRPLTAYRRPLHVWRCMSPTQALQSPCPLPEQATPQSGHP